MSLRLILSSTVLLALAANEPCFAKDSHAHHGAQASAANTSASGKSASKANPVPSKANPASSETPTDTRETVAPPVLPPRGVTQHQVRIVNPSAKIPANASRGQAGAITNAAPGPRNAIGQPLVPPKYVLGVQPFVPLRAAAPAIVHGPATGTTRVDAAKATNRGNVNGATLVRPAIAPSPIGGPAQPRYGINGATVHNKH